MSNSLETRISALEVAALSYRERIRNVTDELNEVEAQAADLSTKADAIAADVTNVESRISGLQAQIDTANTQIADLEAQLAAAGTSADFGPLKATLAGIGDSLSASDAAIDAVAPDAPAEEPAPE